MKILRHASNKPLKHVEMPQLPPVLICFSHLRWDFVFQRPQHLLTRLAKQMEVFYIEEPIFDAESKSCYQSRKSKEGVNVVVPHLVGGTNAAATVKAQGILFDDFLGKLATDEYAFWYYTPMALPFTAKHAATVTIFDCMDELSAFKFAPKELLLLEEQLLKKADVVFTGGVSLYEAKKHRHHNIHAFPSSIDKEHFAQARKATNGTKQLQKGKPKLGFYGVIDERFDINLIGEIANLRPEWQIELVGPVVKIDPDTLPRNTNIQYSGSKTYQQLPEVISSWDIALIPFMLNESTKYISPTKTPEYLAAGLPVVSTPIRDVVNPYGKNNLVEIADNAADFIKAIEMQLYKANSNEWLKQVDKYLANLSWEKTADDMMQHIEKAYTDAKTEALKRRYESA